MSLRVLIVDDEPLARRGVSARLKRFSDITIVAECADGETAIEAIGSHAPDLVFLDVQMPGMSGFEMLKRLAPNETPVVIFLTAYDRYALEAFEAHALDYLLKPIDDERFAETVKRARRQIEMQSVKSLEDRLRALLSGHASPPAYAERFAIRTGTRVTFVLADEIDWIEAMGDYAGLHVGGKTHLLRETLSSLETRLDPSRFVRIHRSTIVQASRIRQLETLSNRDCNVWLADGTQLRASRSYRERLAPWLS